MSVSVLCCDLRLQSKHTRPLIPFSLILFLINKRNIEWTLNGAYPTAQGYWHAITAIHLVRWG